MTAALATRPDAHQSQLRKTAKTRNVTKRAQLLFMITSRKRTLCAPTTLPVRSDACILFTATTLMKWGMKCSQVNIS